MTRFAGHPHIQVACLLSNRAGAYALERARQHGVPTLVFNRHTLNETETVDHYLAQMGVTAIALAGFLLLMPPRLLAKFAQRVLNLHPALLPAFGGPGMYGHAVHEAVSASGRAEAGITIHLADEVYDHGRILASYRLPIAPYSPPAAIEALVRELELAHYGEVIEQYLTE